MNSQLLKDTAQLLFADHKGLLAMDESNGTCNNRFEKLGIPQTVEARRAYRELIVTTPGLGESIGGAILFDETIRQQKSDGTPFVKVLNEAGIHPNWLRGGLCGAVTGLRVWFFCGSPVLYRLFPCDTTCRTQKFPRPFHDPEIGHQRCQTIQSVSSGKRALTWYGTIRAV